MKVEEQVMAKFTGDLVNEAKTIKGTFTSAKDDSKGTFKLSCLPIVSSIKDDKPYANITLPEGEDIKVSTHKCGMWGPAIRETGWGCDGRTFFPFACLGGITDFYQTSSVQGYNCKSCGFDFCGDCMKYSLYAD